MTRAELRFLPYEFNRCTSECGWHHLAAVTVDDDCAIGPQCRGSLKHVTQHRLAADCVQDLRKSGVHARTLARGKDHDVEWGFFHGKTRR
jgi:hypothetical protein